MEPGTLKNAALTAWIKTYPVQENLDAFLLSIAPNLRSEVSVAIQAAFRHADTMLDRAAKEGPVDMAAFEIELYQELSSKFDWIDRKGLSALRSYVGWYAWHEGYSAN